MFRGFAGRHHASEGRGEAAADMVRCWIVDEIWSGSGGQAAGSPSAFRLRPDLVALGKAGSASLPLSALRVRSDFLASLPPGDPYQNVQVKSSGCRRREATLRTLQDERLVDRAAVRQIEARG